MANEIYNPYNSSYNSNDAGWQKLGNFLSGYQSKELFPRHSIESIYKIYDQFFSQFWNASVYVMKPSQTTFYV